VTVLRYARRPPAPNIVRTVTVLAWSGFAGYMAFQTLAFASEFLG